MTRSAFESFYTPSYKNFEFVYISESEEGGKKVAIHEYINSNKRYIEELGIRPESFNMDIVIYGDLDKRNRFKSILNQAGAGTLVHPIYGSIQNVVCESFSINTSITRAGEYGFSVNFKVTTASPVKPKVNKFDKNTVSSKVSDYIIEEMEFFVNDFVVPKDINSFVSTKSKLTDFFSKINDAVSNIVNPIKESLADFKATIDSIESNINNLILQPQQLADGLLSIYQSAVNLANTPAKLESFWNSLLDYGRSLAGLPGAIELNSNTVNRKNLKQNVSLIDEMVRTNSLALLCESVCYKESKTADEIIADKIMLNKQFELIFNEDAALLYDIELLVSNVNLRQEFNDIKTITNKVLNDKIVNAWKIYNTRTNLTAFSLLTYRYYGSFDNLDTIIDLNRQHNVSGFANHVDLISK